MKTFMAFWSIIRRFRAFFSVGLLTFIPGLNLIATWSYAGNNLSHSGALEKQMRGNISQGSAFDQKTIQIWYNWAAAVIVSLCFTAMSVYVNNYAHATWPQKFDADWMVTWNVFHWLEIAAWCITGFFISANLIMNINAIYVVHREWDPRFMDSPTAEYIQKFQAAVEARKNKSQGVRVTDHHQNPKILDDDLDD